MKINNRVFKISIAVLLILSAALAFFRFDMLNGSKSIDSLGLYTDKAQGNLFGTLVFILIAITVVFAFLLRKSTFEPRKRSVVHTVSSVICTLLVLTVGISAAYETAISSKRVDVLSASASVNSGPDILLVIETLCAFAAAVYFFSEALSGSKAEKDRKLSGVLALLPVVWLAARAIRLFMNVETQINTSDRSFTLLFIVVTMMFFICEAELSIPKGRLETTDKANSDRAAKYTGFGLVAVELAVVFVLVPVLAGTRDTHELICGFTDMALALFAAVRSFSASITESN